jgi:ribosomal protein L37AE/L43A
MSQEKITLSRAELYEKVWTTPMRKLATEFGLSDVGLAKVCRRHNIPRPGLGYWACIQAGQKLKRTALPPATDSRHETVEILMRERDQEKEDEPAEKIPIPLIPVRGDEEITHALIIRIQKSLSQRKTDERGILLARLNRTVPVEVSLAEVPRTLRILQILFSSFEKEGLSIEWPSPYNGPLQVVAENEKARLRVTEIVKRKKHEPTAEELARQKHDWWSLPRWDYILTGHLSFAIVSTEFPEISRSWSDGKRRRLENCLGEIVVECQQIGLTVKNARKAKIEAERRRIREQKLEALAATRRYEYERKVKTVTEMSQAWNESKMFRDFAMALQARALAPDVSDDVRRKIEAMIDWTVRHAVRLNPLSHLDRTIRQFNGSDWY